MDINKVTRTKKEPLAKASVGAYEEAWLERSALAAVPLRLRPPRMDQLAPSTLGQRAASERLTCIATAARLSTILSRIIAPTFCLQSRQRRRMPTCTLRAGGSTMDRRRSTPSNQRSGPGSSVLYQQRKSHFNVSLARSPRYPDTRAWISFPCLR